MTGRPRLGLAILCVSGTLTVWLYVTLAMWALA